MEIISFDDFAARQGNTQFAGDVAIQRLPNTSDKQRKQIAELDYKRILTNANRRNELVKIYDQMVASGEIRPPTHIESLIASAQGHDDNPSVQAARRLLEKKGIDWKIAEMENN